MEWKWKSTVRFVFAYLVGFTFISVALFLFLRFYKNRNFSEEKLETMISTVSNLRDKTDDPCRYAIYGEPATAKLQYIKVNLYCGSGSKSINTMDLRAIKDNTVGGALKELARVNNFQAIIKNRSVTLGERKDLRGEWLCMYNRKIVTDYSQSLSEKGVIDCVNGLEEKLVDKFYETL